MLAKEWRQQAREEMFRARCVLARALRDDEAAYGGVELLMAAEVQRRKRRAAGELERMVGKRFHSTWVRRGGREGRGVRVGEAGDGANESAVEVEDDEVSQLTGEAAVTTEGQDERDERRGDGNKRQRQGERAEVVDDGGEMAEAGGEAWTAARSAASYAALTDITERRGVPRVF